MFSSLSTRLSAADFCAKLRTLNKSRQQIRFHSLPQKIASNAPAKISALGADRQFICKHWLFLLYPIGETIFKIRAARLLTRLGTSIALTEIMVANNQFNHTEASQVFDNTRLFQRLTLIDICCGPPLSLR